MSRKERKVSRIERGKKPVPAEEIWTLTLLPLGIVGVPVVLTMASLLFFSFFGMAWTETSYAVFCLVAFVSNVILLPLAAGLTARNRERRQKIAGEMMSFFSRKVTTLYALAGEDPTLSRDARAAEVFEIYSRADREVERNVQNPLVARETIERGVSLADEVLADHRTHQK